MGRRLLGVLMGLVCSAAVAAAPVCPAGQQQVCVLVCFCAPGTPDTGVMAEQVGQAAAGALQQWLLRAREVAVARGVQPMPLHIRVQLEPFYPAHVLNAARYRVGGAEELNAANAVLQNPDVSAVTLVDVVIFRHAADAEDNLVLWAHELTHVEQYQAWGVAQFAARYIRDYSSVEAPAYRKQQDVANALGITPQFAPIPAPAPLRP